MSGPKGSTLKPFISCTEDLYLKSQEQFLKQIKLNQILFQDILTKNILQIRLLILTKHF